MKKINKILGRDALLDFIKEHFEFNKDTYFILYKYDEVIIGNLDNEKSIEEIKNAPEDIKYIRIFNENKELFIVSVNEKFKIKIIEKEIDDEIIKIEYLIWKEKDMNNRGFNISLKNIDTPPSKYEVENFVDYDTNGLAFVKDTKISKFILK